MLLNRTDFAIKAILSCSLSRLFLQREYIENEELACQLDTGSLVYHLSLVQVSYCKTVFAGLLKKSIKQQQLIQNLTVCVLTETWKVDHISPALRSFH